MVIVEAIALLGALLFIVISGYAVIIRVHRAWLCVCRVCNIMCTLWNRREDIGLKLEEWLKALGSGQVLVNWCKGMAEKPILVLLSIGVLLLALGMPLVSRFLLLPGWFTGYLTFTVIFAAFVCLVYFLSRPISSSDWSDTLPAAYFLGVFGLVVAAMILGMVAQVPVPFSFVFVALLLFLFPFTVYVRRVLVSPLSSTWKIWFILVFFGASLGFILMVLGAYNVQSDSVARWTGMWPSWGDMPRIMHQGAKYFMDFPDPSETTSWEPFGQFILGFIFNTLVIGSLASAFSDLFGQERVGHHEDHVGSP